MLLDADAELAAEGVGDFSDTWEQATISFSSL
jgi:hypothetical protein